MNTRKIILASILSIAAGCCISAKADETIRFAFITDNHYSSEKSIRDLRLCIEDINTDKTLDFVILGGDITDFGSDEEIEGVKAELDRLCLPYYVVAGNHDAKWSESGGNTMKRVFGYEYFEFEHGGWRFLGTNCGPDMRMTPALLPKEAMLWLGSREPGKKSIFINHFPQDTSVLNYFDVTRTLKKIGVQFEIGGHWHQNRAMNYDGIPAVLGRATLAPEGHTTGYSIFTIEGDRISVSEKRVFNHTSVKLQPWYINDLRPVVDTVTYDAHGFPASYPWYRYDVNDKYPEVKELWKISDDANIVAGFATDGKTAYYTTASGFVRAVSLRNGKRLWSKEFPGKIFSTPALEGRYLVFGCTDGGIYALDSKNGKLRWRHMASKSVLASPVIKNGKVFAGASDGIFRCLDLKDGSELWRFDSVEGFVECRPLVDDEQVVFGTWANRLYSLNPDTGSLQWVWRCEKPSRMYSPAAVWPVKSHGKIFIAVPDRRMYAIDAATGKEAGHVERCAREAVGLSEDAATVYTKSMWHKLFAFDAATLTKKWEVETTAGYEISPTPIIEINGHVLMPTDKGNLLCFSAEDGHLEWIHKFSIGLVNPMQAWSERDGSIKILASTMDGTVTLLIF
ncbi:MAG: PQQ-binding-like beta-propeller repeat protein [Bacteroidales bacterium]|nr:PQQ-binding-like beta-propeller repeat protein [Bacteroidales bacterium]